MTKGEIRRMRKQARANGQPLTGDLKLDRNQHDNCELGSERLPNGQYNTRRANYLDKVARYAYDYDRDF